MAESGGPIDQFTQPQDGRDADLKPNAGAVGEGVHREAAGVPVRDTKVDGLPIPTAEVVRDAKPTAPDLADRTTTELLTQARKIQEERETLGQAKKDLAEFIKPLASIAQTITGKPLEELQKDPAGAIQSVIAKLQSGNIDANMMNAARQIPALVERYAPKLREYIATTNTLLDDVNGAALAAEASLLRRR
jgi:hypothetical protein